MSTPARLLSAEDLTTFMLEVSDLVNGTLDLDQILQRVAVLVQRVVDYEIFAILLLSERTQEMRMRFAVGHLPEVVEKVRVRLGQGVTGMAAQTQEPQRIDDVRTHENFLDVLPGVRSELAVPIVWKRRVIGVIDVQARAVAAFSLEHQKMLLLVASRIANALENARLYRGAVRRERTLSLLNDLSREMTAILGLDELLQRTAAMVRRVIDFQLFSVLLVNGAGTSLEHRLSVKAGQHIRIKHDIPLGRGIVGAAAAERRAIVVKDVREDARYITINDETRSELAVPLIYQDRILGVLDLEHTRKGYYNEHHARTLTTLAAQMAIAIGNARLYEQVLRAEQRMERELRIAQAMQRQLLPAATPHAAGLAIAMRTEAAQQLGGDLYDCIPYRGQRLLIALGDVAGKGSAAALYGAMALGMLRTQALQQLAPAALLQAVNQALWQRRIEGQFIALACALWSPRARKLCLASAGLPYPLWATAAGCHPLELGGIPLGLLPDISYDELTIALSPGDVVAFVSDGITEWTNDSGEEYGRRRLQKLLERERRQPAEELVQAIFADAAAFSHGQPAADDRTVVILKAE